MKVGLNLNSSSLFCSSHILSKQGRFWAQDPELLFGPRWEIFIPSDVHSEVDLDISGSQSDCVNDQEDSSMLDMSSFLDCV